MFRKLLSETTALKHLLMQFKKKTAEAPTLLAI